MRRRIKGILMSGKQFSLDSRLDLFHGIETSPTQKTESNNLPVVEDSVEVEEKSTSPSGKKFLKAAANFRLITCFILFTSAIYSAKVSDSRGGKKILSLKFCSEHVKFFFKNNFLFIETENTSETHSPMKDNLDIPTQSRHCRSKSVDHQTNLTINNVDVKKKICQRCGHKVGKVDKPEAVQSE